MRVRFWGVRGSVPWATPQLDRTRLQHAVRRGAQTNEPVAARSSTPARASSASVRRSTRAGGPMPILLTHYHWDHMQGLPFFTPFYSRGWSPRSWRRSLGDARSSWRRDDFSTRRSFRCRSTIWSRRRDVTLIQPRDFEIGGFQIRVQPLTHPGGAFAYRIKGDRGDLVYATDHEFGDAGRRRRAGRVQPRAPRL